MKNFKFKSLSSLQRYAATLLVFLTLFTTHAWGGTRRIYFDYSLVTMWANDGAKMCVHCWGGITETNYEMSAVAGQSYLIYADIDDRYTDVCFYRAASVDGSWWNQTQNRSDITSNNRFKIKNNVGEYDADKGKYLWADSGAGVRWAPGSTIDGLIDVNNPHNQAFSFSGNTGTYSVTLSAHCTYQFKILEGTTAYGLDNNVFTGPISNYASSTSGYSYRLATAGAGEYTFTWNKSTKKLSISFPSVNHPSIDYCYLYDHGWGFEKQYIHVWNSATSIAATTWPGTKLPNQTTINGETYFICAPGDYANFQFSNGISGLGNQQTTDLSKSACYGKGMKHDGSSWGWRTFSFSVTLTNQVTTTSAPSNPSVEFNGTALTSIASAPACNYYTFGGYYTAAGGGGSQLITANKAWVASVSGYTDGSKKWIHEGGTAELFAKWTQSITLNQNGATTSGSTSLSATYNAVLDASGITNPEKDYYTFAGWTNGSGGSGTVVIDENKAVQTVASWTDGDKKWIHNAASTLYAKWTENLHDVDVAVAVGNHGSVSTAKVTNIGVATASGTITATADEGYHFTGWTIPSGVTLASGTTSSESITINATADSKIITANFAANTYAVKFNANYPSGNRFNNGGSMSNQAFTYDATQYLTANAFACEGYTFAGWATSEDGSVAHTDQKSVSNLTTTNGGTVNLYAVWNDDNKYVFDGNGSESTAWTTAANWTKGAAPSTSSHNVILLKPVVVPANATKEVASVRIATEGEYTPNGGSAITAAGKLTIEPKGMLIVTNAVQNCVITDNAAASASSTTAATLHIESGAAGNGALVWGTSGTPGKAQVDFYTISGGSKSSNTSINQYIGTPFSDESNNYNYYNAWTFKVNAAGTAWERLPMGTAMDPFVGYNIIYNGDAGHCFEMEGTLVSNANVGLTAPSAVENVLANSWMAPIQIANFNSSTDFSKVTATIYIFNSTSAKSSAAGYWGNYTSITVNEAGDAVIPSMQSFSVIGGTGGTITLNYNQLVKTGANADNIEANLAPRRDAARRETIWASQDTLQLFVNGANGWMDELKYYIHEEFSNTFENGWDGHKLYGYSEAPQLYAVTEDGNMAINCVPSVENNVIGFHAGTANNEYTFTFAYSGDEELYLKDTKLNIETLINTEATYTFTSEAEDSDMRFIIIKRAPAVATDAETVSGDRLAVSGVQKIMHNGQLYIIRDGGIYDATGTMVK